MISIQPELEIGLLFEGKVPGFHMKLLPVEMDFMYKDAYIESLPEAYEALLLDVLEGDATQFMRADQIEMAWKAVMPILDAWKKYPKKQLKLYPAGSWGPPAADALLKPFAKEWFRLDQRPNSNCPSLSLKRRWWLRPEAQPHNSYFSGMNHQRVTPHMLIAAWPYWFVDRLSPRRPPADTAIIQNSFARREIDLDGRWNYIIDPYQTGYYDYRRKPYDESPSGKGGFYDDKKQVDKSELIEYDFDHSPTLKVPGGLEFAGRPAPVL